ncbi:MAG: bifunctional ADP-heptose synthase [Dehalococcoidia bacterium]
MSVHLRPLVNRLAGHRLLVVGDVCLDEYLIGRPERLAREAPVPVLDLVRRDVVPGAAANPAINAQALGGTARLVAVVGDDPAGHELRERLAANTIDVTGLVVDPDRQTSLKTRVMADTDLRVMQQIARIDRGSRAPLSEAVRGALLREVEQAIPEVDIVLVSDYRAGVLDNQTIAAIGRASRGASRPVVVDSQGDLWRFAGYTLVRSNRPDAEATLRRSLATDSDFEQATAELRNKLGAQSIVITRGAGGVAVRSARGFCALAAANRSEVFDAVGAGDTVIAVLALATAAGIDAIDAARLANVAAGLVVRRFGNAVTTPEELAAAVEDT